MLANIRTKALSLSAMVLLTAGACAARTGMYGVRNFAQVDEHVFRGAQPSPEGWRSLANQGVRVVLDLRRDGEDREHYIDDERHDVEAAGMRYVSIPMEGVVAPSHWQIAQALALLNSGERVFVHCREGKDRTGTIVACYRITHDRWARKDAMLEANDFGMHWYEVGLRNYVMSFRESDVANPRTAKAEQAEPLPNGLGGLLGVLTGQRQER